MLERTRQPGRQIDMKDREEGQGIESDIPRDYKFLTGEIATRNVVRTYAKQGPLGRKKRKFHARN